MYECSNVDTLRGISNTWTDSNGYIVFVLLANRLIEIICQGGPVLQGDVYAVTERPWALDTADNTVEDCLDMAGETPQSSRNVSANKIWINFFLVDPPFYSKKQIRKILVTYGSLRLGQILWIFSRKFSSQQNNFGFTGVELTFKIRNKIHRIIAKMAKNVVDIVQLVSIQ
jgi:hypothetical protein